MQARRRPIPLPPVLLPLLLASLVASGCESATAPPAELAPSFARGGGRAPRIEVTQLPMTFASDINARGQVVGFSGSSAILWDRGERFDLGSPGDGIAGRAINDRGQVIANSANGSDPGYFWDGELVSLGAIVDRHSLPRALNNRGQVVGLSARFFGGDSKWHAFLWEDGVMTDLGTLGGSNDQSLAAEAVDVNDRGQVVGASLTASGERHAFIWERGVMTDLGTLGGDVSLAVDINARGQVVGRSSTATGETHAFLWERGVMTDLGALGGTISVPSAVNDRGQVIGIVQLSGPPPEARAFVWERGEMTILPSLSVPGATLQVSSPRAINARGQVVGLHFARFADGRTETRAVLWQDGQAFELPDFGPAGSQAVAINDRGQIVGQAGFGVLWTVR